MTTNRHGSAELEFPSDCESLIRRKFDAPAELLFDVLTKPEHVTVWFTDGDEPLEICDIDLRVGGHYRQVGVFANGVRCSFHGTFLEIERPVRTVATWVFDGRPDDEAVETVTLHEEDGVTTMTSHMIFKDRATRDRLYENGIDGIQASWNNLEDFVTTLAAL
jgi:uncharacterized protein YndB with AHSA1/START domain